MDERQNLSVQLTPKIGEHLGRPLSLLAHPRVTGGTRARRAGSGRQFPLTPNARGTLLWPHDLDLPFPDHPHVRGEHGARTLQRDGPRRSSPHMRETRHRRADPLVTGTLIPTCAGNTGWRHDGGRRLSANPRMRGEHDSESDERAARSRSSPPARGTRSTSGAGTIYMPLIPSFKGNTSAPARDRWTDTAHPRVLGEHVTPSSERNLHHRSSPHARGTPLGIHPKLRAAPLIPRMRGEHTHSDVTTHSVRSSPHARGNTSR